MSNYEWMAARMEWTGPCDKPGRHTSLAKRHFNSSVKKAFSVGTFGALKPSLLFLYWVWKLIASGHHFGAAAGWNVAFHESAHERALDRVPAHCIYKLR